MCAISSSFSEVNILYKAKLLVMYTFFIVSGCRFHHHEQGDREYSNETPGEGPYTKPWGGTQHHQRPGPERPQLVHGPNEGCTATFWRPFRWVWAQVNEGQIFLATVATQLFNISRTCCRKFAKRFPQSWECHYDQLPFSSASSYVSAMVPVKSPKEYYVQQEVIVLFCETVERWVYRGTNVLNNYSTADFIWNLNNMWK